MMVHLEIKTSSEKQLCRWSNTHLKNSSKEHLFRWRNMENTEPIYESLKSATDKLSSGTNNHRLRADIDMDGSQFSCEIENRNISSTNQITPVTFRVGCPQLDKFKDNLASIYLAQPEVPQDSWPPVSNKTYINLALIKQQQSINYGREYTRLTIRGDMDDILHHKEIIEYKNIFDGLKSESLLLIEGRPGSGKTTLVRKITRDWAASEVKGPMRLVLLVSLRVLNLWEKPVTLEDILNLLNLRIREETLNERNGKGICFIFDGLDEFSPLEGENSIVYKIIYKAYLPQSIVIVASRPAALANLRQRANKTVEVIGFPKDQTFEYFDNYFRFNRSKTVDLRSYLMFHPNVLHVCYLPIHAAMVAFLFEVMGKVPRTETEIYKHFTHSTLMRSLSKKNGQDKLEVMDIDELLSGEEKELFSTICEHAFEITALNKQVFDQDKKMRLLLQNKIEGIALGLVTVDRTAGLYGFKNIYTFLHLTYQEYLAAVHISTLSDEDQQRLIEQYRDTDHMRVVWKFYFGLVNFEGHEHKIRALVNRRQEMCLFDIQCAYESQQETVCNCLMEAMNAEIMLERDIYLTTPDFTALGYLLANSCKPASLSLIGTEIDTESVDIMLAEIGGKPLSLYSIHYDLHDDINENNPCYLGSIRKLLLHQHDLKVLKLCYSHEVYVHEEAYFTGGIFYSILSDYDIISIPNPYLGSDCLDDYDFSSAVSTSLVNLKELSVSGFQVGPKMLSSVLYLCKELMSLSIHHDCDNMSYNISRISLVNLKELYLSNVQTAPKMLSSILQCCKELTSLTLYGCTEENAIQTLLSEFSKCKKIERVICSSPTEQEAEYHVKLTKTTAMMFSKAGLTSDPDYISSVLYVQGVRSDYFQTLTLVLGIQRPVPTARLESFLPSGIKVLELHQDNEDTFPSIIECIPDFSVLEKLVLTGFKISHGATLLADILGHCTALQEVDLSHCFSETPEGIETILNGLRSCRNLRMLTLNNSRMKIECVRVLASCVHYWPNPCDLNIKEWGIGEEEYKALADYVKVYCPKLVINPIQKKEGRYKPVNGYCIEMREKREEAKPSSQEASSCSIGEEGASEVFVDNIERCHELTDLVEMREKNEETKSNLQNDSSCCCTLF